MALADARAIARAERDWARADALRARIDEAGWKVEDAGFSYALTPAAPPDLPTTHEQGQFAPVEDAGDSDDDDGA